MGCFLDADRPGVVLPALRHWPLQLRVPLALPELLVQQALRVWVLPLPVLPEGPGLQLLLRHLRLRRRRAWAGRQ